MSLERSIETTGESVEEAIAKGLAELGVGPAEVIVEVLDEPSRGMFGLGARPARVRLQMLSTPKPAAPPPPPPPVVVPPASSSPSPSSAKSGAAAPAPKRIDLRSRKPDVQRREDRPKAEPRSEPRPETHTEFVVDEVELAEDDDAVGISLLSDSDEVPEAEYDDEAGIGRVVVNELLERMGMRNYRIVVRRAKPSRTGETAPWILDVSGGHLDRLIGKRGDTLAALQYITRLITSRELQRRSNLIVDVDGYKVRRAQMLRSLALRMAAQAVERGRVVSLEPMPPHERRIIHLTLRDHEAVVTKSIGEGTARKVTIVPKTLA